MLFLSEQDKKQLDQLLADHETLAFDISSIIETDDDGFILFFKPTSRMSWASVFYVQNLMIMQRLFVFDELRRQNKI